MTRTTAAWTAMVGLLATATLGFVSRGTLSQDDLAQRELATAQSQAVSIQATVAVLASGIEDRVATHEARLNDQEAVIVGLSGRVLALETAVADIGRDERDGAIETPLSTCW